MNLTINGIEKTMPPERSTVQKLIEDLQLVHKKIVIEVNGQIVRKEQHEEQELKDGDTVEVVHFVGGG